MAQTPLGPEAKIVISRSIIPGQDNRLRATLHTQGSEQRIAEQRYVYESDMTVKTFLWTISSAATFHHLTLEFDPPELGELRA